MSGRKSHVKITTSRTLGKTDARSGGWAGHLVGDTEPQTVLAYHVKTAKRRGEMERNVPVVKKTPGKPFKPKGRCRALLLPGVQEVLRQVPLHQGPGRPPR